MLAGLIFSSISIIACVVKRRGCSLVCRKDFLIFCRRTASLQRRSSRATGRLTDWQAAFCFFPTGGNVSLSQIRSADISSALPFPCCMFDRARGTSKASEDELWEWQSRGKRATLCHRWHHRARLRTSCSAEEASNWICWSKTGVLS